MMVDWNILRRRMTSFTKQSENVIVKKKHMKWKHFQDNWWDQVGTVVFFLVALCIGYWGLAHSPAPKLANTTPQHIFSSERAFSHVKVLATDIGYRLVGSRGLEQGQQYIVEQLEHILNSHKGASNLETLVEKQTVNGTYRMKLDSLGNFTFHTVYTDIENIVVRIQPQVVSRDIGYRGELILSFPSIRRIEKQFWLIVMSIRQWVLQELPMMLQDVV